MFPNSGQILNKEVVYSKETIQKAYKEIENGRMSLREAGRYFKIPKSSLHNYIKKYRDAINPPTMCNRAIDDQVVINTVSDDANNVGDNDDVNIHINSSKENDRILDSLGQARMQYNNNSRRTEDSIITSSPPQEIDSLFGQRYNHKLAAPPSLHRPDENLILNRYTNYIYLTPKELVDRLRVLWNLKLRRSTTHDMEIITIIEMLREKGIIY